MTERDFAEDLAQLLTRGLIEVVVDDTGDTDEPHFQPTAAGLAEITDAPADLVDEA